MITTGNNYDYGLHYRENDDVYRKNVGIMLLNNNKEIFVGKRIRASEYDTVWQMPQGGVKYGETEEEAMLRELGEEVGIQRNIEVVAKSSDYYYYDIPIEISMRIWKGRFIGQKQRWFLVRFTGDNSEINIRTIRPEFKEWSWSKPSRIVNDTVFFKRGIYAAVAEEFGVI